MRLTADDFVEYKSELYFVPIECTVLCKIGSSKSVEIVDRIPGEYIFKRETFSKIIVYEDVFYLIPKNGDRLWSFNCILNEWKKYDLDLNGLKYKFMDALVWDSKLVMIGCYVPNLVVFDLKTLKKEYLNIPYEPYKKLNDLKKDAYYRRGHYLVNDSIYLASALTNEVCKINLKNGDIKRFIVGNHNNMYNGLFYDGNNFWLSPRNRSSIVKWDGMDKYQSISLPQNENATNALYLEPINIGTLIMIPAYTANYSIILKSDGKVDSISNQRYNVVKNIGNKKVSITPKGYLIVETDNLKNEFELDISKEDNFLNYYSKMDYEMMKKTVEKEKDIFQFDDFLNCVKKYG